MKKLHELVVYVNENKIEGDYVECGVYKGGSIMNMALSQLNYKKRVPIHLYDTFTGMTKPTGHDVSHKGVSAARILENPKKWCVCSLEDVKRNVSMTKYPEELFYFHKGDVVDTLKKDLPDRIAILRLDTDWYKSTKLELEMLYPKLVKGGVLILDDYGYWKGARKAADEYFESIGVRPKLQPTEEGVSAVFYIKDDE